MVDSDFFTQFNKFLIVEQNRILLDYKNCDYTLELLFSNGPCKKIPKVASNNFIKKVPIKAVYGIVQMEVNNYLVVVTKASVIGQIYHRKIFQMQKVEFFCLSHEESAADKIYVKGLSQMFGSKYFYFSDEYDLTNSLQSFIGGNCSMKNKRLSYMYNSDWIDDFIKVKAYEWITGFVSGFISINFTHTGVNNACEVALVSRRDKRRQGKRWLTRGTDLDGHTANTAETEVIFLTESGGKENIFSNVQLRGSMPFFWTQDPDLKWGPKVYINSNDKLNSQVAKKNYDDIKTSFENCTLVNLIDKKGSQKRLGEYFEKMHNTIADDSFKLIWFDFHAECKNMKYENLSKLLDMAQHEIENYGFFHLEYVKNSGERASKKSMQKGVFRTNCMDCLDRTNVVQSVISRQYLLTWLIKLGIVTKSKSSMGAFERLPDHLQEIFRNQWTRNADVISILYSGTPAMKTDFTQTGKRTWKGAMKDGHSAVKRFFLGNFYDNKDQDFIDFSLGKLRPRKNADQKIRHGAFNGLFLIAAVIIFIPFAVNWGVSNIYQETPMVSDTDGNGQVSQNQESTESNFGLKAGISILLILLTLKTFQMCQSSVLRKPIRLQRKN